MISWSLNEEILSLQSYWKYHVLKNILSVYFLQQNNTIVFTLQNERTPLSVMFPGSQKAFLSFFFTSAAESSRSILLSSSELDIFAPVNPKNDEIE